MAGLWTLLFGGAVAASGIKHAADNAWCKQNLRKKLPNGIEYYTDTDGKDRLMDGSMIVWYGYGSDEKVVKLPHHEVIYDAKGNRDVQSRNDIDRLNEQIKDMPLYVGISNKSYRYDRDMRYNYGFFERRTGKELVLLKIDNYKGKHYYKGYVRQITYNEYIHSGLLDKEIEITEDEWHDLWNAKCKINEIVRENEYAVSLPII